MRICGLTSKRKTLSTLALERLAVLLSMNAAL